MEKRLRVIGLFFLIASLVVLVRLFYWQVIMSGELSAQARQQHQKGLTVKAPRGSILASDESWLTTSKQAYLVFASIPEIDEPIREIAIKLAPLLADTSDVEEEEGDPVKIEESRLETLMSKEGAVWVPLKHKITPEVKDSIDELNISGIGFELVEDRMYPEASAAAHLLGFVGKDEAGNDKGYFGLEGFYDLSLTGKPGFVQRDSDAKGIPILSGRKKEITAVGGVDLVSSIDKTIQLSLEKNLKYGMEHYGASAATAIVMEPDTGAILGMASYPSFDPVNYSKFTQDYYKNPAISNTFEPGSVFKPVVMASALDAGVLTPESSCSICSGPVQIGKYSIGTWNDEYYPNSSMTDVIVHSDNVGMVFVGTRIGKDKLYDYLVDFGFGDVTSIDLQGEASSILRNKKQWGEIELATATFGQGLAVTPIQLVKAMAIIANGGESVVPHVVTKIKTPGFEQNIEPGKGKRVISEKASQQITDMMVAAVKNGESKWIQARGYEVAGKTGTAQIPIQGHYDADKTIASFVGFAPASDPKFVMLVTLREPQSSPWASETAAPLWFSIAEDLFAHYGIQPSN